MTPALASESGAPAASGGEIAGEAPVASGTANRAGSSRTMFNRGFAGRTGPAAPAGGGSGQGRKNLERKEQQGTDNGTADQEETTAAGRIGNILAALPLSKLKIVIGKSSYL